VVHLTEIVLVVQDELVENGAARRGKHVFHTFELHLETFAVSEHESECLHHRQEEVALEGGVEELLGFLELLVHVDGEVQVVAHAL